MGCPVGWTYWAGPGLYPLFLGLPNDLNGTELESRTQPQQPTGADRDRKSPPPPPRRRRSPAAHINNPKFLSCSALVRDRCSSNRFDWLISSRPSGEATFPLHQIAAFFFPTQSVICYLADDFWGSSPLVDLLFG